MPKSRSREYLESNETKIVGVRLDAETYRRLVGFAGETSRSISAAIVFSVKRQVYGERVVSGGVVNGR